MCRGKYRLRSLQACSNTRGNSGKMNFSNCSKDHNFSKKKKRLFPLDHYGAEGKTNKIKSIVQVRYLSWQRVVLMTSKLWVRASHGACEEANLFHAEEKLTSPRRTGRKNGHACVVEHWSVETQKMLDEIVNLVEVETRRERQVSEILSWTTKVGFKSSPQRLRKLWTGSEKRTLKQQPFLLFWSMFLSKS